MKRAMTIMGMLLVTSVISCQKTDTNEQAVSDADTGDKIVRARALKECEALLAEARKADPADPAAELAAWDNAAAGLHRLKRHIDPARWLSMGSEVAKAQENIIRIQTLRNILTTVDNARESGDKDRLMKALRTATTKPGIPPKLVEAWGAEIESIQESVDFSKVTEFLIGGDLEAALDALDAFIEKYPENRKAKVIKEGLEKKEARLLARKEAFRLFDQKRWAEALAKLKVLRVQNRGDREIKAKMHHCQYKLEMVKFEAAVKAGDYAKAKAAGERARVYDPDAWDTVIDPKLAAMRARKKVAFILAKGAAALKNRQYADVRKILDHLKDAYPEAKNMIRQSRYR
jgi:hypothetical protein